MTSPTFRDQPAAGRFEVLLDGQVVGRAEYHAQGDVLRFTHTEVDPRHEGQGLASQLAKHALDAARQSGRQVLPACRFIAEYIRRHREYADLVPEGARARWGL